MLVLSVVAGAESITRQQAEQLARQFITKQGMYGALSQAEPHQARARDATICRAGRSTAVRKACRSFV